MVYRLFTKRSNFMTIFLSISIALLVVLLIIGELLLKEMYAELEILRIENVALRLKLAEILGGEDDQA
jgi:hypothetical protein